VGIFGLGIGLDGLVDKKNYKETVYNDPLTVAQDMSRILKHEKKCDLVICLSHIGYQYKNEPDKISDTKLATLTQDIDLIIGGHTHTLTGLGGESFNNQPPYYVLTFIIRYK
jgi:5'-nucleotidase